MFHHGPRFQDYYREIPRWVRKELEGRTREYLLAVDENELIAYFVSEAEWEPLICEEEKREIEPLTERLTPDGRSWIKLRVPTKPHPQRDGFLNHLPDSCPLSAQPGWHFVGDTLVFETEPDPKKVERIMEEIRKWIGGRNTSIEQGNKTLPSIIAPVVREYIANLKQKHQGMKDAIDALGIPIRQDPDAPAAPVSMTRKEVRVRVEAPKAPGASKEPYLRPSDVLEILKFVDGYARQFEVTPEVYAAMEEEKLRDLLVGMLNANFKGAATGETFNKLGKTDISLRVEGGHVLVFECKYWHGAKAYGEALDQLFRYLTWRQNFGVLIHFCRLKDMSVAMSAARGAIGHHSSFLIGTLAEEGESHLSSRHRHPQDPEKGVEIHHLFYDLSV